MRPSREPTNIPDSINWKILRLIAPYLLAFKLRIGVALVFLVAAKGVSILGPFILKYIVDALDKSGPDQTLVSGNVPDMVLIVPVALLVAYGLARFASVLFGEIRDTVFGRVTERAMRNIGLEVFRHLHHLDLEFHLNRRTGGLARDVERGVTGVSFLMRFFIFNIAPTIFEISVVTFILFYNYGASFAVVTVVAIVLYIIFSVVTTEWRTGFIREANRADSASNSRAVDSLLNYETVKYFNNEAYELHHYDLNLATWEGARRKNRLSLFTLNAGQAFIITAAMTVMMILAAQKVSVGEMTLGDFVLINAFMLQLFMPLNFLGFVYREIKASMANIEQMFSLLGEEKKVVDVEGAPLLKVPAGKIEFNNLCFHYHSDRPILKDISFTVEAGQKVAIVGASGSGKSTLIKLLFRFYDLQAGQICIDGQDIKNVTQLSLREAIGIVPQDTVLFNDSILENIRYGRPEASDEEVMKALAMAKLEHFIQQLPKGVNTKVGERGLKVSGGEKQRIAIARTLLKNPPILLFDEATSSLDSHSEQAILQSLADIAVGHTSLVIAHRLSTVVDADNILVMQDGSIVEQGDHNSLLEADGVYAGMWSAQQKKTAEK